MKTHLNALHGALCIGAQKIMLSLFVLLTALLPATGQEVYLQTDFMKVEAGKGQDYVAVEKELWKKIHQARINQGDIVAWQLYQINFTGTNSEYNYATVTVFENFAKVHSGAITEELLTNALPEIAMSDIIERTYESRQLVKSELFQNLATVGQRGTPSPFLQLDFMHVNQENSGMYTEVETEIWQPIHQEFLNAGQLNFWGLYQLRYPGGAGGEYQFVTANAVNDFTQLESFDYAAAFEKAHSGKDVNDAMEKTMASRELVRSELWELIDYAAKQE